jgi:hypothetical protein
MHPDITTNLMEKAKPEKMESLSFLALFTNKDRTGDNQFLLWFWQNDPVHGTGRKLLLLLNRQSRMTIHVGIIFEL